MTWVVTIGGDPALGDHQGVLWLGGESALHAGIDFACAHYPQMRSIMGLDRGGAAEISLRVPGHGHVPDGTCRDVVHLRIEPAPLVHRWN